MVNTLESQTEEALGLEPVPEGRNLAQEAADQLDKEIAEAEEGSGGLSLPKELQEEVTKVENKTGFKGLDSFFGLDTPSTSASIETITPVVEPKDPFVPRVETVNRYGMPLNPSKVKEGSSLRPKLRPEDFDPDKNRKEAAENFESAIDYIASMGWLLGQKTKDAKGQDLTKIVTGLDQRNPDHKKAIMGFFWTAEGSEEHDPINTTLRPWCAAFVHHVLVNLGADTLEKSDNRLAANSFMDYGTAVDGIENAQEGDIIIWDWPRDAKGKIAETSGKKDGRGDHVAFYAGDRITGQGEADYVNVVGGNQSGTVSLRENNNLYVKRNIIGIRRITKNDITVSLTKDLAKQNPIFKPFIANITDPSAAGLAQGGLTAMGNQTEEAFPLDFSFSKGPKSSFGEVTSPNINLGKGNINVSLMGSKNKNNQEYPDGVIVDTENKTVGFSINGKAVFSRDGDKYFQAGFKKMNNKTEEKVNLPSGEELEFKDGSVGKSYNFEAGLGDLVVKGSKQSSDTGKSQYSGQVIYRLNDNAEIFIEDTNAQDAKVGFSAKYNFAQGGLTDMNEQTQMAFALGGEAETVDPVSGNDVPPGSLPVEVRDDIDAKLSEGEYVVPADVVRFFGVKFFEDLRTEAKQGLQQMDMDGRIGGEPISEGPQMQSGAMSDQDIDSLIDSEMQSSEMSDQDIDSLIDSEIKNMNQGGMVGQKNPTNSMYSDPNKTDQVISKLSSAASQDPEFSRMLRERGISVPNTNATQTPDQMQDANRPDMSQQPKMVANKGGLMGYDKGGDTSSSDSTNMADYFDVNDFDAEKYKENLLSTKKGGITRIEVTTPGGGRMFMYWDISLPLPKGYALVSAKKASTKSEDKGNDRDRDPAPKNIDVSKLSLSDLQIIKLDVQRKKATLFGLAGPFAIPIYNRAMKDIEDAVAGHTKYVNSLKDGAAKTEGLKRLRNYEEGVDVLTGKDLAEMPGMFAVLKGDLRNISDKFGESSEEEVAEISLEKRITGIYTKEANLAGGQKIKPEDSVFAKTLNAFAKQSNEVKEIKSVKVDPVVEVKPVEVKPVEAEVDGTSTAATNNAASDINLEGYNGSASASFRYDEGGNLKSFLGGNFDVADAGNGYQAYIDRQIAAEDAGQRNSSSNDDFKAMHKQAMANLKAGSGVEERAEDTTSEDEYGGTEDNTNYGGYTGSPDGRAKGGLIGKPQKTSYDKGGYVTSKKTKQRTNGLASRP